MRFGIDTSKHQASKVDYFKAKNEGIDFVILRVGCGNTKDICFEADYRSARACGLNVGVYFYTYSTTVEQARIDATRVLGWLNNRGLQLPVCYDLEDNKQNKTNRKRINSEMYNAFARTIREAGYEAMLYTGEYMFNHCFDKDLFDDNLWIAKYSTKRPNVDKPINIWQYSSNEVNKSYFKGALDQNEMIIDCFKHNKPIIPVNNVNPYPQPKRVLKKGCKGNDVKWLQWYLKSIGYPLVVDGSFGGCTKNCVMQFQKNRGLKVDGICGPATRYNILN